MTTRRSFITQSAMASALLATTPFTAFAGEVPEESPLHATPRPDNPFPAKHGIGGVGMGNGWHVNTNEQITQTMQAAWDAGVRYFDTSPFYGYGLSERRMGHFLAEKERSEYVISTKIGRIFEADPNFKPGSAGLWKGQLNFKYHFDYTAAGVRRSIEDSLQRLGLSSIDLVLVHDLSPDTGDLKEKWVEQFEIARKGAFPELTKMREEGIIKGWGMGVNTPQPIMKALEVAEPDIMLVAIQYSLFEHQHALDEVFPAMAKKNVKAIIGGPLNGGFAAGLDRWNYGSTIPPEMAAKRNKINAIISKYKIDLRTVALQFCAAHPVVGSVIPGASRPEQAKANALSFAQKIPADLWKELKAAKLIAGNAPEPGV